MGKVKENLVLVSVWEREVRPEILSTYQDFKDDIMTMSLRKLEDMVTKFQKDLSNSKAVISKEQRRACEVLRRIFIWRKTGGQAVGEQLNMEGLPA